MSEGMPLSDVLKSAPTATSLSGLSMLLADSSGNFAKMSWVDFASGITQYILSPSLKAENIDLITTAGLYILDGLPVSGTLPNILYPNYGHLFVLRRGETIQQVIINRYGIALRFKPTPASDWQDWVIIQ